MARILGVDIPNDKQVAYSLTYIYGIGLSTAKKILEAVNIDPTIRVKNLSEEQLTIIRNWLLPWIKTQKRSSMPWTKNKKQCSYT